MNRAIAGATRAMSPSNGSTGANRAKLTLRCGIYVRVSTDRQAAQEFSSLDAQEAVLRELVASKNMLRQPAEPEWTIVEVYREKASAKDTNRPEFQKMLRAIEEGRINMIVFIRLDRFSRSLRDFLDLQDFLKTHHCGFVSRYDPAFDTSSPHGEFMVRLFLSLAELERKLTSTRTREKIVAARQNGRWTGGNPPLGYDLKESKLVVNECEAEQLREIFRLYIEKQSTVRTVEELNRRGWRTKRWTSKENKERGGTTWSKAALLRVLSTPVYLGRMPLGKESFPSDHTPILDQELFDKAQAVMRSGREHGPAGTCNSFAYLLRGLVHCAVCGSAMSAATTKKKSASYRYYRCTVVDKQGTTACPVRSVPAEPLEEFVVNHLRRLGREPELVEETLQAAHKQIKESHARLDKERMRLETESRRIQAEARQVMTAKGSLATAHLADLEERQARIASRLAEIEEEKQKLAEAHIDPEEAKKALALLDPAWDVLEALDRERLISLVVESVKYHGADGTVAVTFNPLGFSAMAMPLTGSLEPIELLQ